MTHPLAEDVPARHVQQKYQVSRGTLRTWTDAGKVQALRSGGVGKRLYRLADIERVLGVPPAPADDTQAQASFSACYARVSSAKQQADLDRQCAYLQQQYPQYVLYHDVGSGLNFKRPRFLALLDAIHAGLVREVVVADKDRLCRFGWELVAWLMDKAGTRLVVHRPPDGTEAHGPDRGEAAAGHADVNHELSDDIINHETANAAATLPPPPAKKARRPPPPKSDDESEPPASPPKPPPHLTRKIRLYPTPKQRQVLRQWFGAVRWTYNQAVDDVENKRVRRGKRALRTRLVNSDAPVVLANPWLSQTPYDIRFEAVNDLLKAYKTCFALRRTKKQKGWFKMQHRVLKAASASIVIHAKHWCGKTSRIFYAAAFKKAGAETTLAMSEPLPEHIAYDCRLQRTRIGHYYFCLLLPPPPPTTMPIPPPVPASENQAPRILSIDPGVRTFLTGYEPATGRYVEWGAGDMKRLVRLGEHLDDLMSRTAKDPSPRRRYRMRQAQQRMRLRIRNLVDEMHKKLVAWLVDTYELILLPTYAASGMVNHEYRRISRPTVRALLTWAPYRFKQRLLMKAKLMGDRCCVRIVDEHLTTKTCGCCGTLNHNVGGSPVYCCPRCMITLPRDWNAARNIFLRFVATSTWGSTLPGLSLAPWSATRC